MYSTIQEIHVEVENRIQQITALRHRSIFPQYIDIALNRAAKELLKEKYSNKANFKQEGFGESTKRDDDFQSLKRGVILNVIKDNNYGNRGYVLLPADYLHYISSTSYMNYDRFDDTLFKTNIVPLKGQYIDFKNLNLNAVKPEYGIRVELRRNDETKTVIIPNIFSLYKGDATFIEEFGFIDNLTSQLLYNDVNVRWEYPEYFKQIASDIKYDYRRTYLSIVQDWIIDSFSMCNESGNPVQTLIPIDVYQETSEIVRRDTSRIRPNDLISSETIDNTLGSFYHERNRHLSPICELQNNRLYVSFGEQFDVQQVYLRYIKKPTLFCFELNYISDINYLDEVIDLAVSNLLLTLKDDSYQPVKQNTITK